MSHDADCGTFTLVICDRLSHHNHK